MSRPPGATGRPTVSQRPVVLVGLMGSGKTTVARQLARRLGRPLRDSDEDLERRHGVSAAQLYQRYGVEVLHQREADELRRALAQSPPPVVAAAASVVDDPDCRAALGRAYVVWLDAAPEVLASRVGESDHRPHYDRDPRSTLARQYRQRAGRFRDVADLCVDVDAHDPEQTVEKVLAAISSAGPAAAGAG